MIKKNPETSGELGAFLNDTPEFTYDPSRTALMVISTGLEFMRISREWVEQLRDEAITPEKAAEIVFRLEGLVEPDDDLAQQSPEAVVGESIINTIEEGFSKVHGSKFRNAHSSLVLADLLSRSRGYEPEEEVDIETIESITSIVGLAYQYNSYKQQLNSLLGDYSLVEAARLVRKFELLNQLEEGIVVYVDESRREESWQGDALITHLKLHFLNEYGREFNNTLSVLRLEQTLG